MGFVSRGFRGRRREEGPPGRVPPGQYTVRDFPVLSAGPTPQIPLDEWRFTISGEVDAPASWTWEELRSLPSETVTRDIHCVTKWSKLDTAWEGVSLDVLLDGIDTAAEYALAHSYGGYTTNLPIEDITGGKAWIAYAFGGERAQLLPRPRDRLIDRAGDPERPHVERRVRRRADRQNGELVDDVLARWDAGAVDERAVAPEAT